MSTNRYTSSFDQLSVALNIIYSQYTAKDKFSPLDQMEHDETLKEPTKESPLGIIIFLATLIVIEIAGYYNYSNNSYRAEDFTTVEIHVSHAPEYLRVGRKKYIYETKGKEFNCRFWIDEALPMVKESEDLMLKILAIKEGEILKIAIHSGDTTRLVSLYHKMEVMGLSTNKEILFTPEQTLTYSKHSLKNWLVFGGVVTVVLLIIAVRKINGYLSL